MKEGSYVSIDLDTKKLKIYFSDKNPNRAYEIIKKYFIDNGFSHIKDTNYLNPNLLPFETIILLRNFSEQEKWFPSCKTKVNVMPVSQNWDLTEQIDEMFRDKKYEKQKEKEYNQIKENKKNQKPSLFNRAKKYKEQHKDSQNIKKENRKINRSER